MSVADTSDGTEAILAGLDRPDRIEWQAAGLLVNRRPPGADGLVSELKRPSWWARVGRTLGRWWSGRRQSATMTKSG